MYTNTKVMFSKIASGMTIFMMIFSMVGPMNARAQEATLEEIPAVVSVLGCMDSSATNYNVDATEDDDSCEYEKQEESSLRVPLSVIDEGPDLAQISAYKIICPSEDLLPNWGDGAANITASTAGDFINENPECEIVDWTFEWADEDTENPGDNVNEGGSEWTSFASAVMVPAGEKIWVREQMQDGYIPFSGNTEPAEDDEDGAVSAEFYCSNDVLHYDNYDFINPLNADTTYHCVAFNVLIPVLGCTDKNALNYNPDATEGNENAENCEYPDPEEGGICEEGDEEYTSIYTSDEDTMLGENPAEILTFIHDAWTATISDASWIWSTDPVELAAETDEVETFTKTFQVTGTPTSASLMIAADNFYSVDLNGEFLCADAGEVNFSLAGQDTCVIDVSDLDNGTNTLEFTVTNKHLEGETANSNPAGLMYKLEINGDCEACEMQEGWAVDYFNYEPTDVGMNLPTNQWYVKSAYGNPLSADNTFVASADAWTGWSYANPDFSQVENDLMFGASNFFPFDSGAGLPFKNESTVTPGTNNGKDFHFGLHAKGFVTAPSTDDYGFTLTSDDDVWIYVNGELIVDNSGVHGVPGPSVIATIPLNEGVNEVDLYYAERHFVQAALNFEFTDDLVVMTTEDCLPPPPELCMNDGANNYGQPLPCTYDPEPTMCDPEINLIQNGGFESPEVASGGWGLFPQGDLMGWILEWIYDSEGTPTLEIQNNVAGAPDEGNQHAELDGNHPVGMYQVIETVPGETYDFSYAYSARPGRDAEDNRIWARVDNYADATLYNADHAVDATYATDTAWTTYSTSFVADSEATIMFHDMGTDTSYGGYIDDVSLTCNPDPVIEMCPEGQIGEYPNCYPPMVYDLCLNLPGTQTEVPNGFNQTEGYMCYSQNECSDGIDNSDSEDELSDANDPACHTDGDANDEDNTYDPNDNSESNTPEETPNRSSSGSRVGGGGSSGGSVLGAATDICNWNTEVARKGWKGNIPNDVETIQNFLNLHMNSGLLVDKVFGPKTEEAVKAFQMKYMADILTPWNITSPTGIWYLSTTTKAKEIMCGAKQALPTLINWSANPTVR